MYIEEPLLSVQIAVHAQMLLNATQKLSKLRTYHSYSKYIILQIERGNIAIAV